MTIIRESAELGGQSYPLLHGYDWEITTTDISDEEAVKWVMTPPSPVNLRWVRQDRIADLRTNAPLNFELSMKKGGFVLSKRLSRIFRPSFYWTITKKVDIFYDPTLDKKQWDGAGLISYRFLNRLMGHLPKEKESVLKHKLRKCGRVEFTVLSSRGEDKGHALVVKDLDHDMVLPCDTKTEVKWLDNRTLVSVQPIHSKNELWLDIQSHINLHPFFDNEKLLTWLDRFGDEHLKKIVDGNWEPDEDDLLSVDPDKAWQWPVHDYLASGGKAMWFSSVVRQLANQHLTMIRHRTLERLRLPIPGGRYYVFTDALIESKVKPGRIRLSPEQGTAWVSSVDWPRLAEIWGGADQDDALCIFPFRKTTGDLAVLAWRQPNQLGEYIVLEPEEDTPWSEWPEMDERLLPELITEAHHIYEIDLDGHGFPDVAYSINEMSRSIRAAQNNIGAQGMYINLLLALKAMDGKIPERLPCTVEAIMDAVAKNGNDTTPVKNWIKAFAYRRFLKDPYVPEMLVDRVTGLLPVDQRETLLYPTNHWLDVLVSKVKEHVEQFGEKRDELAKRCMPPTALFEYGYEKAGEAGEFRAAYSNVLRSWGEEITSEAFEAAWQASSKVLEKYYGQWQQIMAGVAVRAYLYDTDYHADACMWQPGIVRTTIEMLRDVGLIGDLVSTRHGTIAQYRKEVDKSVGSPLIINGPWFALGNAQREAKGLKPAAQMRDMPKEHRDLYKQQTQKWAREGKFNIPLTAKLKGDRLAVYKGDKLLGFVKKGQENAIGELFAPVWTAADTEGNLHCIIGGA